MKYVERKTKVGAVPTYRYQKKVSGAPFIETTPGETDTSSKVITTQSKPNAFPSVLRSKHSAVQALSTEDVPTGALTQETCPQCGSKEMRFYTLQLRSADEGSTVFYNCEKCGHK